MVWIGSRALAEALAGAVCIGVLLGCNERFDTCQKLEDCADGNPGASGGQGGASSGGAGSGSGGQPAKSCADLECSGEKSHCDEEALQCVECLETEHCDSATASVCEEQTCVACATNEDCAHIEGKGICDDGECVECTVSDESSCGENSCNPETKVCTSTRRGSRTRCLPCVADSECQENYRCVPMDFQGQRREGGYCLRRTSTGCVEPFAVPTPSRSSLSGAEAATYCGVSETRTTCEAVLDLLVNKPCSEGADDECGAPGLNDARCEMVNFVANRCSYSCSGGAQCPNDYSCGSNVNDYCGAAD